MDPPFTHYIQNVARARGGEREEFLTWARERIAAGEWPRRNTWIGVASRLRGGRATSQAKRLWVEYLRWLGNNYGGTSQTVLVERGEDPRRRGLTDMVTGERLTLAEARRRWREEGREWGDMRVMGRRYGWGRGDGGPR